jgi:DNA-binding CsgD family transcriptional regulator
MAQEIDVLTDKEKEALRLLLAGHDAKSSASELGISVHAVNDRLRNARRKLSVGSSREAARILGDFESDDPQSQAHRAFGMEKESPPEDTAVLNQTRPAGLSRSAWLTGGMLIMSIAIAAIAVFMFAGIGDGSTPASTKAASTTPGDVSAAEADPQALSSARIFLNRVDASDWDGSWEVAGTLFQTQVSAAEWAERVEPVRAPLGAAKSRKLTNVQRASSLPGVPEGEFQILQFRTDFAGREGDAIETVVMMQGESGWEVNGYFIA